MSYFTNIFHILCTRLGIKESEWHLVLKYHGLFIGTSKPKRIFWTYSHWESLTDTFSKLNKSSSNKTCGSWGLQICNRKSMVRVSLNCIPKDRARMSNPSITILSHQQGMAMGSRTIVENGASSKKSLGTILMNVTPNSLC
jgi:hypothetical protein